MSTLFLACRTLAYAAAFVAFWLAIAFSVSNSQNFATEPSDWPSYSNGAGIVLMIAGAALGLHCVALFVVRGQGTPAPFAPPRRFVAVGPYRYVRNPMYLGGGSALLGLGVYRRSFPILLLGLAWFLLLHLLVVFFEEPVLRRKFGAAYEDYCKHVHRWLPRRGGALALPSPNTTTRCNCSRSTHLVRARPARRRCKGTAVPGPMGQTGQGSPGLRS